MNDKENIIFMSDPRRIAAEKELNCVIHHIRTDVMDGSACYYLTVLPPLLQKLKAAYEEYKQTEKQIMQEMEEKET